jgi:hypothetical protein
MWIAGGRVSTATRTDCETESGGVATVSVAR